MKAWTLGAAVLLGIWLVMLAGVGVEDPPDPLPLGRQFRDCPECPLMVEVPAGSFMMGSPDSEARRYDDEGPVHRVTIARPFAVGVYEVTFAEWDACVSGGGCGGYRPDGYGGVEDRGSRPVVSVGWNHAKEYATWLSGETGAEYRLLSESEWEYAARAGTEGPFHTGTTITGKQANFGYSGGARGGVSGWELSA